MNKSILSEKMWIPTYQGKQEHIYILITSLNLGGAEKIVSDQLWANHYSQCPHKVSLIVIYEKEKEHSVPPSVNVIRLKNKIENADIIFNQIAYEKKPLVCHLINDEIVNYLFSKNLRIHLVIHNDKKAWANSVETFNHVQLISLVAVCNYVKKQLEEVTTKPVYTFRHHINPHKFHFDKDERTKIRSQLNIHDNTVVIGMTGRISQQKNYFLALDVIYNLKLNNPDQQYKLVILGGVAPYFSDLYIRLINKVNILKLHKDVVFAGFRTDAHKWLNMFDIALNTSYFEGLSMACQEFMHNGLPVVLSNVCGQKEIYDKNNQLHFFDIDETLNNPVTENFNLKDIHRNNVLPNDYSPMNKIYKSYQSLVENITVLIVKNKKLVNHRIEFTEDDETQLNKLSYGSHNLWSLLNSIYSDSKENICSEDSNKTAFITSNLMLGGAQRSLINLLKHYKNNNIDFPLILLNQSNTTQFYNDILKSNIDHYLCHSSKDVFDICYNLFNYILSNNINQVVLWNVESKVKILLDKFLSPFIKIIDVSPGDYCFVEMNNEQLFQEAAYHYKNQYYDDLTAFVSKYTINSDNFINNNNINNYILPDNKTFIIPNGVVINAEHFVDSTSPDVFRFLICGRIAPSKHLEVIFEAFNKILSINKKVELHVCGYAENYSVDYYDDLLKTYQDLITNKKIILIGHHDKPQEIMKNYSCLIVLGTHQGSPNVVLEAASCKLPVIANDSGGTREIINQDTGILLPEIPEVEALYSAMKKMVENYSEYTQKAQACFDKIEKDFSMEKMAESYLKVIGPLIK